MSTETGSHREEDEREREARDALAYLVAQGLRPAFTLWRRQREASRAAALPREDS